MPSMLNRLTTKVRRFLCDHVSPERTIRGEMGERYIELACPHCGHRYRADDVTEAMKREAPAAGRDFGPSHSSHGSDEGLSASHLSS